MSDRENNTDTDRRDYLTLIAGGMGFVAGSIGDILIAHHIEPLLEGDSEDTSANTVLVINEREDWEVAVEGDSICYTATGDIVAVSSRSHTERVYPDGSTKTIKPGGES